MEVRWITERDSFSALMKSWDRLAALEPDPFMRHAWFQAWWDGFASDAGDVRVCGVWDGEELVAAMPLQVRHDRAEALADEHMVPFTPLVRDEHAFAALVDAVLASPAGEIILRSVLLADWRTAGLRLAARRAKRLVLCEAPGRFPGIDTTGDYAAYRQRMKSRWGSIERKGRKLRRDHGAVARLVESPRDLDAEVKAGLALEAHGWKGRAGSAMAQRRGGADFMHTVARGFAATGQIRISQLEIDGELVAWDIALLDRDRLHSMVTTYDERYSRLSPGLVLRLEMIERCFEMGLDGHELGGSDLEWKRRFATSARENGTLRIYRLRPRPLARYAYRRWVRPLLKRLRDVALKRGAASAHAQWPPTPLRRG